MCMNTIKAATVRIFVASLLLMVSHPVLAGDEIGELLKELPPPKGVVFEMLTHEPSTWPKALSYIKQSVKRLHSKYADMPVVIVSHGMEEFALLKDGRDSNAQAHSEI